MAFPWIVLASLGAMLAGEALAAPTAWGGVAICGLLVLLVLAAWGTSPRWLPPVHRSLQAYETQLEARLGSSPAVWVVVASAVALFAELMVIRWHASDFALFGYFKNISLLSCFLGLGLGFSRARQGRLALPMFLPALALQLVTLHLLSFTSLQQQLGNPVAEQASLGLRITSTLSDNLLVFGFLTSVFAVNAWIFVPLGQLVTWFMAPMPRLTAYGCNLIGSLLGVGLFYLASALYTPPAVWLLVTFVGLLPFLLAAPGMRTVLWSASLVSGLVALAVVPPYLDLLSLYGPKQVLSLVDVYSPYQVLNLSLFRNWATSITVNRTFYQRMLDFDNDRYKDLTRYYNLPYVLKSGPQDVLILGSGSGNDVVAALRHGVQHVDAVEIDPTLLFFGRLLHPQNPYADPRVRAINDDARHFMKHAENRYDLIVFGLLDSHSLLSGASSVRLDSFVYTVESLRQARALLKPHGLIALTFVVQGDPQARKLYLMLQQAFDGQAPRVYEVNYDGGFMYLAGDLAAGPQSADFPDRGPAIAHLPYHVDPSTDDWPFFYMPARAWPWAYVVMLALLLVSSAGIILESGLPLRRSGFSWQCFFLGAGFMLVETKGITELALVFGSTWQVIGIVIAGIMVLGFLANLVAMRLSTIPAAPVYVALVATLVVGLWASSQPDLPAERLLLPFLLTLPMLFSGLAFSAALKGRDEVSSALSANLFGAMVGGALEYNAMYFGYHSLYYIAMAMYLGAWASTMLPAASAPSDPP